MRVTVKLPKSADSTDEVAILDVRVAVGDAVEAGQTVVEVETDKATVEVPSPVAGTVREVLIAVDDEVSTGAPLIAVETRG